MTRTALVLAGLIVGALVLGLIHVYLALRPLLAAMGG